MYPNSGFPYILFYRTSVLRRRTLEFGLLLFIGNVYDNMS